MKARDSAAIAQKSRITKARKVLKKWADDDARIELVTPGLGLRVRGTIRQPGDDPGSDDFLFVSDSREVTSRIFLILWKSIVVERGGLVGTVVHLRSEVNGDSGITLVEEYVPRSKAEEMSSLRKQFGLWAKMQTKLLMAFQFSFAFSYWTGTIEELRPGVFALPNKGADQKHIVDTAQCDHVEIKRIKGNTIVTLTSRSGHFLVVLSDSPSNIEAAYKLLVLKSTTVH